MEDKKVLCWDKPKQAMSTTEWRSITADSAPPGVYQPNMSEPDKLKWKAKLVKGEKPRVEVRKTFHSKRHCANVLFVFEPFEDEVLTISTNGKFSFNDKELHEFAEVLKEAGEALMPVVVKMGEDLKAKQKILNHEKD